MTTERAQIEAGIAALEAQRAALGDAVLEMALGPIRAKLAALDKAAPARQLRQVTVLFLDVVGSTSLGEKLDPEALAEVLDGALARATAIVEAHRGRVLNYAGDNLLAVFGADEVREDDAERAVRCGLALRELGAALAAEVLAAHGHAGFNIRLGAHTGGVLLGGVLLSGGANGAGGDAQETIRGGTVNIAARMEQAAPPGALRISHETYRHVRGVFDVEAQAPVMVKGVDQPVATYLVRSVKPRAFRVATRGVEGVETRMVGRDGEFEVLQAAFTQLFATPCLSAVSIVGEAGLGKSRLLHEFSNWTEARPENFLIFQGRATPQTPDQPYGLLRDIIAWRWQIADDDSMAAAKAKLEAGLLPLFAAYDTPADAEAHVHLLGFLIGLDYAGSRHLAAIREDGKQLRNRAFFAAAEMFRRLAAQRGLPILLQLDDLHWADDPSLDFLAYLSQVARAVPLLVIGVMRGTLFERRAAWLDGVPHRRIDLHPLDRSTSGDLADELLKKLPGVPAALRELLTGRAEGNPFYMEELVKMLIDQGAISTGEVWRLDASRLLAARVPGTLTGVLQARLDGLPPAERLALQEASVIGMVFWDQALAALDAAAPAALPHLARRELALPQAQASLAGMREYAFKHQVLHQVTLETVLKRIRRDLHAKAADWFAGLTDAGAADYLAVAAQHYEAAGEAAKACEFFTQAAEASKARFANEAALGWIGQALALLASVPAAARPGLHWRLLDTRERIYDLQGQRDAQAEDLATLAALAGEAGDTRRAAEIAYRQSARAMRMGDYAGQAEAARRGMALATAAADDFWRLKAQRLLASATGMLGDVAGAVAMAEAGLAQARALGLREAEAHFLNALAILAELKGDLVATRAYVEQALAVEIERGDRRGEIIGRCNLAISEMKFGRFAAARAQARAALAAARAIGDRYFGGAAQGNLADIALLQGEDTQALSDAREVHAIAVETQARDQEVDALGCIGEAELALGRLEDAAGTFSQMSGLAIKVGRFLPDALAGQARVALAQGDAAAAVAHLAPVLDALTGTDAADGEIDRAKIRLTCWRALSAAADPRAPALLALAYAEVQSIAAQITDPALLASYQTHPTTHAILTAWATHGPTPPPHPATP